MKKITGLMVLAILLLPAAFADAQITYNYYRYDATPINNVRMIGYTCLDALCDNVSSAPFYVNSDSGISTSQSATFPTQLEPFGYALYYFRSGYLPMEYTADWHGTGSADFDIFFPKMENASSEITSFDVSGDGMIGHEVAMTGIVESAFTQAQTPPKHLIESYLDEFYSSVILVKFRVEDNSDNVVYENKYSMNLLMDTKKTIMDFWTPLDDGNYTIYITTDVADDQVSSSVEQERSFQYSVKSPDTTGPEIKLIKPKDGALLDGDSADLVYIADDSESGIDKCMLYLDGSFYDSDSSVSEGIEQSFHVSSLDPGNHEWYVECIDDSPNQNIGKSSERKFIVPREQDIISLDCFPMVIVGKTQSCSAFVRDDGKPLGGSTVDFYDASDDSYLGSCSQLTDNISGGCSGMWIEPDVGERTVYATARKEGYVNDTDKMPQDTYQIFERKYEIQDLKVYNDSGFEDEDYDFFRNETMYVKFRVFDMFNENYAEGIVTNASLVSTPGGRAVLDPVGQTESWYYYKLTIPPNHNFLGDSQVFAFAFNFTDSSGGEEWVPLVIRNNPPKIIQIDDIQIVENDSYSLDLSQHESDVEDHGTDLSWQVKGVDQSNAQIVGKQLVINPTSTGNDTITLVLTDLDGDSDEQDVEVMIHEYVQPNYPPYFISSPNTYVEGPWEGHFEMTYRYNATALDPNDDVLTYSLIQAPSGMVIDPVSGMIEWNINQADIGRYNVTVRASDGELYAQQHYVLSIRRAEKPEDIYPRDTIFIKTVRMNGMPDDILKAGDQLYMSTSFENIGYDDIRYVTIRMTCEALGISRRFGPYSGPEKDDIVHGGVLFNIPEDADPGYYTCRATIWTDTGLRRVRHRDFRIVE